jgi:predicted ATPase with chaperone activity
VHESDEFIGAGLSPVLKLPEEIRDDMARTIADLAGSDKIKSVHLAEALQYRPKLMMG